MSAIGGPLSYAVLCLGLVLNCAPDVYPVDPAVHVDDPAHDPLDPGSFTPDVANKVAHARYAINGMQLSAAPLPGDEDQLRATLAELASATGIAPGDVLGYYAIAATEDEFAAFKAESEAHAAGADPNKPLATSGKRLVTMAKQVNACASEQSDTNARARCCQSLAFPAFLVREWTKLSAAEQEALMAAAAADDFYAHFINPDGDTPPSVRLQGIKAWLSVCDTAFAPVPDTVAAFKDAYGDYHDGTWIVELHPISRAKMAGRRIYRKGEVSIAESLADDCSVRETEVMLPRADGGLQFFSYDRDGARVSFGYFPSGKVGVDAVKYTPTSCMGCHYTFDSRRFKVRFPSFLALNLDLRTDSTGAPLWTDHSACKQPGDWLVEHIDPPAP